MSQFDNNGALDWDSVISNDAPEFVTLPEGDYEFEVTNWERGEHPGSAKLPQCPKAIIHIKVEGDDGVSTFKHNLFLHKKTEGMLCQFFNAIGQRQRGQSLNMDWNKVTGSTGKARIGVRKWEHNGAEYTANEIKKFYDAPEAPKKQFKAGKF